MRSCLRDGRLVAAAVIRAGGQRVQLIFCSVAEEHYGLSLRFEVLKGIARTVHWLDRVGVF
jgi:hypothetical protein